MKKVLVIGAGPAGLGAAHSFQQKGYHVDVVDNRDTPGGLCGSFNIDDFYFDRFVHVSFSQKETCNKIFRDSCKLNHIDPDINNIYKDLIITHPVQNNLYSLPLLFRIKCFVSFILRKKNIDNYYDWLCASYGKQFADNFPKQYALKYWQMDPSDLETNWVGSRMSKIKIKDFIKSMFIKKKKLVYYAKKFVYPQKYGYQNLFKSLYDNLNIKYKTQIISIDSSNKLAIDTKGNKYHFDYVVYSGPLTDLPNLINNCSNEYKNAAKKLNHTSGYIVSIGLNKKPKDCGIFTYIYNPDILAARMYFPHKKSIFNTPNEKYAVQVEFYTLNGKEIDNPKEIFKPSIDRILEHLDLSSEDIIFQDIRFEKYANIVFDKHIYMARDCLYKLAKEERVILAGRFGLWDYLWSDQSLQSGLDTINEVK